MAVDFINDATDIDHGIALQTVNSETFEQAVFERLLNTGGAPEYPGNLVESEDVGDTGGSTGVRAIARGGNYALPMHYRFGANKTPEAGAFRDDWALNPELTLIGGGAAGDLQFLLAGSHNPANGGGTGLQIVVPLNALDPLKAGAGRGLLVLNELWDDTDNNEPWMVKDVWDDGADDFVDIFPGYGAGGAGSGFGSPKTAADSQVAVLHFGTWIKNRRQGPAKSNIFSVMLDRYCLTGDRRFRGLTGAVANDYTLEIPDEGAVRASVSYIGRRWERGSATPLNGEPLNSHFVDPTLRDFMVGGEDLVLYGIVTYANDLVATELPTILSDRNITNWTFNLTNGVEAKTNVVGMKGVLPKAGDEGFSGSLGYYVPDDPVLTVLQDLGHVETHQKFAQHILFKDPLGNYKGLTLPRSEAAQTGGDAGPSGDETGSMDFMPEAIDRFFRAAVSQEWVAF